MSAASPAAERFRRGRRTGRCARGSRRRWRRWRVARGRGVPRVRDASRRQDDVRPARRVRDAADGPRAARRDPRADRAHRAPVGGRRGPLRDRPGAEPSERGGARAARPPRRRGHLPGGRGRAGTAPQSVRAAPHAADRRRAAPHGRGRQLGRHDDGRVRARGAAAAAERHAVPLRQLADPVGRVRRRRLLLRRLHLHVHRRAD